VTSPGNGCAQGWRCTASYWWHRRRCRGQPAQPARRAARLRAQLRNELRIDGHPQALLRLGYAPPALPTPRRRVDDVLEIAPN